MSAQESTRERPGASRASTPSASAGRSSGGLLISAQINTPHAAFSNLLSSPSLFHNWSQSGGGCARCALPDPACWGAEMGVQGPSTLGSRLLQDMQKLSGPEDSWPASARSITDGAVGSHGMPGRCLTATSGPMFSTCLEVPCLEVLSLLIYKPKRKAKMQTITTDDLVFDPNQHLSSTCSHQTNFPNCKSLSKNQTLMLPRYVQVRHGRRD